METQEKIQVRTIKLNIVRVASVKGNGEPDYENYTISLSEGKEWANWLQFASMHGYKAMTVVDLLDINKKSIATDELKAKYQSQVDANGVKKQALSLKDELNEQKKLNSDLIERLEALESQLNVEKPKRGKKVE